jgi:hypothetical protein
MNGESTGFERIVEYAIKAPAISCEYNGRVSYGRGIAAKPCGDHMPGSMFVDRQGNGRLIEVYPGEMRVVSTDFRSCDWYMKTYSDSFKITHYHPINLVPEMEA